MTIPTSIPFSFIDLGIRARTQHLGVDELADSIEESGLIQPIIDVEFPTLNFYGGSCYIWVSNREQLQQAMSISPGKWDKTAEGESFKYTKLLEEQNTFLVIYANSEALPATCHIIEEDVFVPATEATTRIVKRIVCNEPETSNVPEQTV